MDIKQLICYLLLPAAAGTLQINGQSKESSFVGRTYELSWLNASPDHKYITFQKNYETSFDTMALVSTVKPGTILYETGDVYPGLLQYSKKGYLFISGRASARYLKLPAMEPLEWTGISKAFFMERDNVFVILKENTLRIYNEEAQVISKINGVTAVVKKDDELFYRQTVGKRHALIRWTPRAKLMVCTSDNADMAPVFQNGNSYIIDETESATGGVLLKYVNTIDNTVAVMPNHAALHFVRTASVTEITKGKYFVAMTVFTPMVSKSDVDIWYANDNDLGKKFQNGLSLKYFVWEPLQNELTVLDDPRFTRYLDVGNNRYLLAWDPAKYRDYTKENIVKELWRYDIQDKKYDLLGMTGPNSYLSPDGNLLLFHDNSGWVLFSLDTKQKKSIRADVDSKPFFDEKSHKISFFGSGAVIEYDVRTDNHRVIPTFGGFEGIMLNGVMSTVGNENRFHLNWYDSSQPQLLKITHPVTMEQSIGVLRRGNFQLIYKPDRNNITEARITPDGTGYLYVKSNYNRPPVVMMNKNGRERILYRSNPTDTAAASVHLQSLRFTNSRGVPLQGLLYYPKNYDPDKKYPMIVGIYELMRNQRNRYLRDGFSSRVEGLNIRHFLEKGYFVYLPDITYDERGPGRSALDCVERSLDALSDIGAIDSNRLGLIGHSHGGYQANFIATRSKRFAAFVAGAGNSDLVRSYHSFNYNFISPFYWQFEEQQYRIFKPFATDKNLYIDNSPVYSAENVHSPILLWAGTKDENIVWDQTMEFYLALRRNHKKVIALFYKGDGHNLLKRANREDLFIRISEWFDYHLKGIREKWIEEMNK